MLLYHYSVDSYRGGGELIYVGDGSDPFHQVRSWWREEGFGTPAEHLFRLCGLPADPEEGRYPAGRGAVTVVKTAPYRFCLSTAAAEAWRETVRGVLKEAGIPWRERNDITLRRGPYLISAVMDESVSDAPKTLDFSEAGEPVHIPPHSVKIIE